MTRLISYFKVDFVKGEYNMAIKLNVCDFEKMVVACKRATAKNEIRPMLKLVNIDVIGNKFRMWSMDGVRVEVDEMEVISEKDFSARFENMYIPKFNSTVTIDLVDNNLEIKFFPSEFKLTIPQNFQGDVWNVDSFIKSQEEIEKGCVMVNSTFLADALKKCKKNDKVKIRKQDGNGTITPIEVEFKNIDVSMKTYILPVRCNF